MAHTANIVVNGINYTVTEFDHTAQEIDDAVDLIGGVRPNLLDNAIFIGGGTTNNLPINQRGQTSYNNAGYSIDRWKLTNSVSTNIITNGLQVLFQAGTTNVLVLSETIQNVSFLANNIVTCSFLCTNINGNISPRLRCSDSSRSYIGQIIFNQIANGLNTITATIPNNTAIIDMQFRNGNESASSLTVQAVKLEIGATQTLAYKDNNNDWQLLPQPQSDYITQLLKCQHYYKIYRTQSLRPKYAEDCCPTMRINPTQGTIVINDVTYYYNSAEL